MYDVVILTENRYINPKSTDWYIDQVIIEDKLLLDELSNNRKNDKILLFYVKIIKNCLFIYIIN